MKEYILTQWTVLPGVKIENSPCSNICPLQTTTMADCSICYEAVIDHPAPSEAGAEATGSFRSSCGHLFHPKCIWKWFSAQAESSCPLCRKKATELEDIRPHEEEQAAAAAPAAVPADPPDPPSMYSANRIRISRANFEQVIFNQGGPVGAWVAAAAEEVAFGEYDEAEVSRNEFERVLRATGARVFSDAEWGHLMAIYPLFSVAFYNRTSIAGRGDDILAASLNAPYLSTT